MENSVERGHQSDSVIARRLLRSGSWVYFGFTALLFLSIFIFPFGRTVFLAVVASLVLIFAVTLTAMGPSIRRNRLRAMELVREGRDPLALTVFLSYIGTKRTDPGELDFRSAAYVEMVVRVLRDCRPKLSFLESGVLRAWAENLPSQPFAPARDEIVQYLDAQPASFLQRKL